METMMGNMVSSHTGLISTLANEALHDEMSSPSELSDDVMRFR